MHSTCPAHIVFHNVVTRLCLDRVKKLSTSDTRCSTCNRYKHTSCRPTLVDCSRSHIQYTDVTYVLWSVPCT
jgi:hypothetical protein